LFLGARETKEEDLDEMHKREIEIVGKTNIKKRFYFSELDAGTRFENRIS